MVPEKPKNSYRVTLTLSSRSPRLDNLLIEALRNQSDNLTLKNLSRAQLKQLFKDKKVLIKGQSALPSSAVSAGTTYIDILGFGEAQA